MKFKNATTAINQELGRIAGVQHSYEEKYGNHNISVRPSFEQWFVAGIKYQQSKGVEFLFLENQLIRVQKPGEVAFIRTLEFYREQYRAKFGEVKFEENAGLPGESPLVCEVR